MHTIANFWNSLFNNLPKIIQVAGYSLTSLLAVLIAIFITAFFWFRTSSPNQKERIFYLLLAFTTIGFVLALTLGFKTSEAILEPEKVEEVVVVEVPKVVPNSVSLAPETIQDLENHLQSEGLEPSNENKSAVLKTAVSEFVSGKETADSVASDVAATEVASNSDRDSAEVAGNQSQTGTNSAKSVQASQVVAGFQFDLYGCSRTGEAGVVICDFAVTNKEADRSLEIIGDNAPRSRIIDSNGVTSNASKVQFESDSSRYRVRAKLVKDVLIKGSLTFLGVQDEIDTLSLLEISNALPGTTSKFPVQFRSIAFSE